MRTLELLLSGLKVTALVSKVDGVREVRIRNAFGLLGVPENRSRKSQALLLRRQ